MLDLLLYVGTYLSVTLALGWLITIALIYFLNKFNSGGVTV